MGLLMAEEIERPDEAEALPEAVPAEPAADTPPAPDQRLDPAQADIAEPGPDFDATGWEALVKQYDDAVQAQQQAGTADDLQGPDPEPVDELDQTASERLAALEQAAAEQRHAELERKGWDDFGKMAERAQDGLPPTLPKDFARRWLLAEAAMDPALWQLWSHRNDRRVQGAFRDLVWRMHSEAQWCDPDTISESADRAALVQALKSGRADKFDAREPAPKFGHLSNRDFSKVVESQYGFDPGVGT
jgi:hypothetical protein